MSLSDLAETMKSEYGFLATYAMYRDQIIYWGLARVEPKDYEGRREGRSQGRRRGLIEDVSEVFIAERARNTFAARASRKKHPKQLDQL